MRLFKISLIGGWILVLATAKSAYGQSSSVTSATSTVTSATSSSSAQQAQSFWGLVSQIPAACQACKEKFCQSCCGQLLNAALAPITLISGGCIKCCPDMPTNKQLNAGGALGACAQIEKDTLEAKARVDAVKCLASVDCHYWPEAEKGLIDALRADKNEVVRFAAALALGNGCCCTKATIAALTLSATGSTKDGNPAETSARVRAAAQQSLQCCAARYQEPIPEQPAEPPTPPERPVPGPTAVPLGTPGTLSRRNGMNRVQPRPSIARATATLRPQAIGEEPELERLEPTRVLPVALKPSPTKQGFAAASALEHSSGLRSDGDKGASFPIDEEAEEPVRTSSLPPRGQRSLGELISAAVRRPRRPPVEQTQRADAAVEASLGSPMSAPTLPVRKRGILPSLFQRN